MPVWTRSLRWRLLGITLAALGLVLLGAGFLFSNLFRTHVTAQFEGQLQRRLNQLTALLEPDAQARPRLKAAMGDPRWEAPYSGLYWQVDVLDRAPVEGTRERAVLRSRSLWDEAIEWPEDVVVEGEPRWRILHGPNAQLLMTLARGVRPAGPGEALHWRLLVAGDMAELDTAVAAFSRQLALYLIVLGVALLLAVWVQLTLGLRPLRKLQAAVQSVRQGRMARLSGDFPAEIDPLVQDFNQVLDQNEQVVRRARQMAGNLAHAIKTPLAVISNLAQPPYAERTAWADQLAEQVGSIRHQVDWHLGRARAASAGVAGLRTEVGPVLEGLVGVMRKVHAQRSDAQPLALDLYAMPGLKFAGESQDLQEMVGNLLDNACKWAVSRVRLTASGGMGRLHIAVEDDGPGLSEAECVRVFERGVRADERVPGTGLGLDITRELATLYHGEVVLGRAGLGGLRAELVLPALPA